MMPDSSALFPKLPGDILYLIAYFSSFDTRVNLIRCNKWLHETCTPLVFKDIYLHAPIQLVKLCINEGAMCMLNRTNSIYLGERLFSVTSWPGELTTTVPDLLIRILNATTSLTRLQIYSSNEVLELDIPFYRDLQRRLDSAASDPAFLPNLTIIIELPGLISLVALCNNRPIVYHYDQNPPYMNANICPGFKDGGSGSNLRHNFTAQDIGTLVRESRWTSPNATLCSESGIYVHMRFPEEIRRGGPAPVQDPLAWTRAMLLASEIPIDDLFSLEVTFEPNPPYQSAALQYAAVEGLHEDYPELEDAIFSYPSLLWSRSVDHDHTHESEFFSEDPLPEWTPCPSKDQISDWIDWWLDALDLNSQEVQSPAELAQTTLMLMEGISFRWGGEFTWDDLPSTEDLLEYLNNRLG